MLTNAPAILTAIQNQVIIAGGVAHPTIPSTSIKLDEALDLVYSDLPLINIFPVTEDYVFDESLDSSLKKNLQVRIEIRLPGSPASALCSPIVNSIFKQLRSDITLGGLVRFIEFSHVTWATDKSESGFLCGASMDLQIEYFADENA